MEEFEDIHIDLNKKIFQLNGKNLNRVSKLELTFENGKWSLLVSKDEIYESAVTKFDALVAIADTKKFSEVIFDILQGMGTSEEIEKFLNEKLSKNGLQTLQYIAQSDYPLSLDGLQ